MMKTAHFIVAGTLLVGLTLGTGGTHAPWKAESAQAQVSRSELIGKWYLVDENTRGNVDSYTFNRNATYVFRAGREKSKSGNIEHSGTWYVDYARQKLVLTTKRRVVLSAGRRITVPAARTFRLPLQTIGDGVLIDGFAFSK